MERPRRTWPRGQRGMGLIEALLVTLLVGSILAVGYLGLQARGGADQGHAQARAVHGFQRAIEGFAASRYRLPCPDHDGDGFEDCGNTDAKGTLPWRTLRMSEGAGGVQATQVAYMVDRSGLDLAATGNHFEPGRLGFAEQRASGNGLIAAVADRYALENETLLDFCRALAAGAGAAPPRVGAGAGQAVAYGLAHPGGRDMDGDGELLDGRNAGAGGRMASPDPGAATDTDDRVVARSHGALSRDLRCAQMALSLDSLALAASTAAEVEDQRQWVEDRADTVRGLGITRATVAQLSLATGGLQMAGFGTDLGLAVFQLVRQIGICALSLGTAPQCGMILLTRRWIEMTATAMNMTGGTIAAMTAAVGIHAAAAEAAAVVRRDARDMTVWQPDADTLRRADRKGADQ